MPSSVKVSVRVVRHSSGRPICSSRRRIWWLTADWLRCSLCAARVNPPASLTATKARKSTGSKSYLPIYFQKGLGYNSVGAGLSLLAYTLPTLVVPPFGERLAVRYRPRVAIPFGLFTIGLGFIFMKLGGSVDQASWLTMFPGCLLAGIGLGLTNTPVTNTTTGSVPSTRAGMASGIDMSARLISLAVNIALMGFVLVNGIFAYLKGSLPGSLRPPELHSLAEKIAAGETGLPALQLISMLLGMARKNPE